jgi:gallidermin-class lantibiotic protection ABC transporter ATP-binding subunit
MNNLMIRTTNLTKKYKGVAVVENVNLEIPENKIYGLLGPNGAGKSTTLKMICGITKPTSGEILYENQSWSREILGDIGALIESPALYQNLTAYENLKVRALSFGLNDNRIKEVLTIVELKDTGKKKVRQFSLGMKQRLGIAMALMNHPKLLILDEPTNGLDPLGVMNLRKLIRSFPNHGITVIYSSHILAEVAQTVDEIGIIVNGQLGYQGEISNEKDLEGLFLDVVRKNQGGVQ